MTQLALVLLVAALAGASLTPLVIRVAIAWGIYDAPGGDRRVHTQPLPRIGGVAVFASMVIGLLVLALASLGGVSIVPDSSTFFFGVLFGGGIIFATGLIDDLRGLRPLMKLGVQFVAALLVYSYGFQIDALTIGSSELGLGIFSLPFTLVWIVGVTNAFNLIDGLDGLATGLALVALAATMTVALVLGQLEVVVLSAALFGALLGFLRYNFNPAQIFLGDSGSLFIGFMLAILSMSGSQNGAASVLVIVPIFALAVPLLDTFLAILRRWLRGVPLSEADGRHLHHRLLALGLPHRHAVLILYFVAGVLAVLGISVVFAPPSAIVSLLAAGIGGTVLLLLYGLRRLQYHEFLEAGSVVVSGLLRFRHVIRAQIYAQDVAQSIRESTSFEQVSAVLGSSAATFGFLHMEVCREDAPGSRPLVLFDGGAARAWKLDYPVTAHDFVEGEDYVLRIWCNPKSGWRPYGAERVSQILAPVIQRWLASPVEKPVPAHPQLVAEDRLVLGAQKSR